MITGGKSPAHCSAGLGIIDMDVVRDTKEAYKGLSIRSPDSQPLFPVNSEVSALELCD